MAGISDLQIQNYIDAAFYKYDKDNTGSLDARELGQFFN